LELNVNVGHQRAIAVGMCYIAESITSAELVVVMDSDGEDNVEDIPSLISEAQRQDYQKIIFANRDKRSEPRIFRIYYFFYRILFRLLTGKKVRFGNFCCVPRKILSRIIHIADLWNHYSSSVIKNIPYSTIPSVRSKRNFGKSKMDTTRLILHGLSAISLYLDVIGVKFLRLSFLILIGIVLALPIILYIKYFTNLAIPGWASYIVAILLNMIITILLFTFILLLQLLNNRNRKPEQPILFYKQLIYAVND
jgi:polyisoprenyl-phosphate glycosyltransferase